MTAVELNLGISRNSLWMCMTQYISTLKLCTSDMKNRFFGHRRRGLFSFCIPPPHHYIQTLSLCFPFGSIVSHVLFFLAWLFQGNSTSHRRASSGHQRNSVPGQSSLLRSCDRGTRRLSLWARRISVRAFPSWWLPHGTPKSPFSDKDISSQCGQTWPDLPGHFEGQMEPSATNPNGATLHPGVDECTESRWPAGQYGGRNVEI